MRELWDKLVEKASDAGEFVEKVTKDGIRFLRSRVGKLPLFTSTAADNCDPGLEVDETHYLLVPYRADECGYALYTMRSLPPGVGPNNSLPKARVFHLHDKSGVALLENLLVQIRKDVALTDRPNESELADNLEALGEHIDRESFKITGGLLIIGGAVAFANPIIGAGIAAKALFPSLGAKVSKLGLDFAGKKLRSQSGKKQVRQAEKAAKAEVQQLKPELYLNPLLQDLERAVSTSDSTHDPLIANFDLVEDFPHTRYLRVSLQALLSVYEEALETMSPSKSLGLHEADLKWFDHLRELQEALAPK
jgi:hypothetical protein